ncbi:MAG TPA: SGNH/GDSL hydrolase family protein [Acidimicrobiales bacterium]|nr:SGNH/GDSL hydrolase family protein [Acidimicrobiales bacterium]
MADRRRVGTVAVKAVIVVIVAAVLAACSSGSGEEAGESSSADPAPVYVAVGASETVGFGADRPATEAWPEVLRRQELPSRTRFVNLGIPGATVATALDKELPKAVALSPTLVTVWLNVNDLIAQVPLATYEGQLRQLLAGLRRGGATRVLVANTPPLDRLPAYLACLPDPPSGAARCPLPAGFVPSPELVRLGVGAYNRTIVAVASAEGAEVVDLHAAGLAARSKGREASLVGADGFHPSTAGHKAVAEAFAEALARHERHR